MKIGASIILVSILLPWIGWASLSIIENSKAIVHAKNTHAIVCKMAIRQGMSKVDLEEFCTK